MDQGAGEKDSSLLSPNMTPSRRLALSGLTTMMMASREQQQQQQPVVVQKNHSPSPNTAPTSSPSLEHPAAFVKMIQHQSTTSFLETTRTRTNTPNDNNDSRPIDSAIAKTTWIPDTAVSPQDILCGAQSDRDARVTQRCVVALASRLFLEQQRRGGKSNDKNNNNTNNKNGMSNNNPGATPQEQFCQHFYAAVVEQGGRFLVGNDDSQQQQGWQPLNEAAALAVILQTLQQSFPTAQWDGNQTALASITPHGAASSNRGEQPPRRLVSADNAAPSPNQKVATANSTLSPMAYSATDYVDESESARRIESTPSSPGGSSAQHDGDHGTSPKALHFSPYAEEEEEEDDDDDDDDIDEEEPPLLVRDQDLRDGDILTGKKSVKRPQSIPKVLFDQHMVAFSQAASKPRFCRNLVGDILNQGGRFLQEASEANGTPRNDNGEHVWVVLSEKEALHKVLGSFRNHCYDQRSKKHDSSSDEEDDDDDDDDEYNDEVGFGSRPRNNDEPTARLIPESEISTLDVLCGSKNRSMTKALKPYYTQYTESNDPTQFCRDLYHDEFVNHGRRFLERGTADSKAQGTLWVELDKETVLGKMPTAFGALKRSYYFETSLYDDEEEEEEEEEESSKEQLGLKPSPEQSLSVPSRHSDVSLVPVVGVAGIIGRDKDVLFGLKGAAAAGTFEATHALTPKLVKPNVETYLSSKNKIDYCRELIDQIIAEGGRPLHKASNDAQWVELSRDVAAEKLNKSFRMHIERTYQGDTSKHNGHAGKRERSQQHEEEASVLDNDEEISLEGVGRNDILCAGYAGRKLAQSLRHKVVAPHFSEYQKADNKFEYCRLLAQQIVFNGGRFLHRTKNKNSGEFEWTELSATKDEDAPTKLYRAFYGFKVDKAKVETESSPSSLANRNTDEPPRKRARSAESGGDRGDFSFDENEEETKVSEKLLELCNKFDAEGGNDFVIPFVRSGGIEDTLKSLGKFSDSGLVQANGLCLLCKAVAAKKDVVVFLQCAEQCIQVGILAMKLFSSDPDVHMNSLELMGLVWDCATTEVVVGGAHEILPFVKVELESGSEDDVHLDVVKQGLLFLWNVSATKEGRHAILDSRCNEAIHSLWHQPIIDDKLKKDLWSLQQRIMQDYSSNNGDELPKFNFKR